MPQAYLISNDQEIVEIKDGILTVGGASSDILCQKDCGELGCFVYDKVKNVLILTDHGIGDGTIVNNCTISGKSLRLMPGDVIRFLPDQRLFRFRNLPNQENLLSNNDVSRFKSSSFRQSDIHSLSKEISPKDNYSSTGPIKSSNSISYDDQKLASSEKIFDESLKHRKHGSYLSTTNFNRVSESLRNNFSNGIEIEEMKSLERSNRNSHLWFKTQDDFGKISSNENQLNYSHVCSESLKQRLNDRGLRKSSSNSQLLLPNLPKSPHMLKKSSKKYIAASHNLSRAKSSDSLLQPVETEFEVQAKFPSLRNMPRNESLFVNTSIKSEKTQDLTSNHSSPLSPSFESPITYHSCFEFSKNNENPASSTPVMSFESGHGLNSRHSLEEKFYDVNLTKKLKGLQKSVLDKQYELEKLKKAVSMVSKDPTEDKTDTTELLKFQNDKRIVDNLIKETHKEITQKNQIMKLMISENRYLRDQLKLLKGTAVNSYEKDRSHSKSFDEVSSNSMVKCNHKNYLPSKQAIVDTKSCDTKHLYHKQNIAYSQSIQEASTEDALNHHKEKCSVIKQSSSKSEDLKNQNLSISEVRSDSRLRNEIPPYIIQKDDVESRFPAVLQTAIREDSRKLHPRSIEELMRSTKDEIDEPVIVKESVKKDFDTDSFTQEIMEKLETKYSSSFDNSQSASKLSESKAIGIQVNSEFENERKYKLMLLDAEEELNSWKISLHSLSRMIDKDDKECIYLKMDLESVETRCAALEKMLEETKSQLKIEHESLQEYHEAEEKVLNMIKKVPEISFDEDEDVDLMELLEKTFSDLIEDNLILKKRYKDSIKNECFEKCRIEIESIIKKIEDNLNEKGRHSVNVLEQISLLESSPSESLFAWVIRLFSLIYSNQLNWQRKIEEELQHYLADCPNISELNTVKLLKNIDGLKFKIQNCDAITQTATLSDSKFVQASQLNDDLKAAMNEITNNLNHIKKDQKILRSVTNEAFQSVSTEQSNILHQVDQHLCSVMSSYHETLSSLNEENLLKDNEISKHKKIKIEFDKAYRDMFAEMKRLRSESSKLKFSLETSEQTVNTLSEKCEFQHKEISDKVEQIKCLTKEREELSSRIKNETDSELREQILKKCNRRTIQLKKMRNDIAKLMAERDVDNAVITKLKNDLGDFVGHQKIVSIKKQKSDSKSEITEDEKLSIVGTCCIEQQHLHNIKKYYSSIEFINQKLKLFEIYGFNKVKSREIVKEMIANIDSIISIPKQSQSSKSPCFSKMNIKVLEHNSSLLKSSPECSKRIEINNSIKSDDVGTLGLRKVDLLSPCAKVAQNMETKSNSSQK